ncbi:class A beta-lactamase [Humibacter sp.]|jgi:beta-lactamase class A|uniref:class A beta-lactamase n=1 Tax=Humibacter sp. TaxID=1940291 RepID=UPI002BE05FCE|nr:class A beta-lactamase [Humibacter sp.]HVX08021.1 class A beta-lactamase [Humibacter sp.]
MAATGIALLALLTGCAAAQPAHVASASGSATASASAPHSSTAHVDDDAVNAALAALETQYAARVGVQVIDTSTGATYGYRQRERFALDSTSKMLTASAVLQHATDAELAGIVRYTSADLQSYSPITSQHVESGMSLSDLIGAALQYSDNTAANLLYERLGGPSGAQAAVRSWGDEVTNLDRTEPDLNSAVPGDPRDTSTPQQVATDLKALLLGRTLPAQRRQFLLQTMLGNTTGASYIPAGVPSTWRVADKTGNGGYGSRNDVAVLYPPGGKPIVLAIYTTRNAPDAASDDDLIAAVTRSVVAALPR